jgi:hypothetical protein
MGDDDSLRAVSQLLWSDKNRDVWFSLGENHEKAYRFGLRPLRNCSADCCHVDGACDSAFVLHAHFPKWTLQMLHIGLAHAFKAVRLNQFHNALKAGSDIKRKVVKRLSDFFVHEFNEPCRFLRLYLFCNMDRRGYRRQILLGFRFQIL